MKEKEIILQLMEACNTLMDEVVGKKATRWGVVNKALVDGSKYIKEIEKKEMIQKIKKLGYIDD